MQGPTQDPTILDKLKAWLLSEGHRLNNTPLIQGLGPDFRIKGTGAKTVWGGSTFN